MGEDGVCYAKGFLKAEGRAIRGPKSQEVCMCRPNGTIVDDD
jgi:hypothetical protein